MEAKKIKELKAKEGYYLTQSAEVASRVYVTAIRGANVNDADWREATKEEKEQYEEQRRLEYQEELLQYEQMRG